VSHSIGRRQPAWQAPHRTHARTHAHTAVRSYAPSHVPWPPAMWQGSELFSGRKFKGLLSAARTGPAAAADYLYGTCQKGDFNAWCIDTARSSVGRADTCCAFLLLRRAPSPAFLKSTAARPPAAAPTARHPCPAAATPSIPSKSTKNIPPTIGVPQYQGSRGWESSLHQGLHTARSMAQHVALMR
jgi:hypothetical protein